MKNPTLNEPYTLLSIDSILLKVDSFLFVTTLNESPCTPLEKIGRVDEFIAIYDLWFEKHYSFTNSFRTINYVMLFTPEIRSIHSKVISCDR